MDEASLGVSACHVWMAPASQESFFGVGGFRFACGHVFGLLVRSDDRWP
jgi:hypothetical protein